MLPILLLACTGPAEEPPEPPAPPVEAAPAPPPAQGAVEIVVINDTGAEVSLDRSFGPAAFLAIAPLQGQDIPLGATLDDVDDELTGGWIATCLCDCAETAVCPECEPPGDVKMPLYASETHIVSWSGRLRVWPDGETCATRLPTPAGTVAITACTEDGRCGRTTATLPTTERIIVRLGSPATAATCADIAPAALSRAGALTRQQVGRILRDRPVADCPAEPSCVAPDALEAAITAARSQSCASFVVPRGERLESIAFLPLPEGYVGGERYTHFYDPDVTRLLMARYEQ